MIVLGLYGACGWHPTANERWVHSSGAALIDGGELVCAISEERLTKDKYTGVFPEKSIDYVLDGRSTGEVDVVALATNVHIGSDEERKQAEKVLRRIFPQSAIVLVDHHKAHAFLAYYSSPFQQAAVFTFDGAGTAFHSNGIVEVENATYSLAQAGQIACVYHSMMGGAAKEGLFALGETYNALSRHVYQKKVPEYVEGNPYLFMETAPGKVMGLSGYGKALNKLGLFKVVMDDFYFPTVLGNVNTIQGKPEDIACELQDEFEQALVDWIGAIPEPLRSPYWCLGGGCALNIMANRRILDSTYVKELWAHPASTDCGLPIGAATAVTEDELNRTSLHNYYTGKSYTKEDIEDALEEYGVDTELEASSP